MPQARILIVEDETIVAMDIERGLKALGYEVVGLAETGEDALRIAEATRPALVLMDIQLRGRMNGVEAARHIHDRWRIPVLFLTAYADANTVQRAKEAEPFGYLLKPFEDRELHTAIEVALQRYGVEEAAIKEAEEALQASEGRFKHLIESLTDYAVFMLDSKGRVLSWNSGAQRLLGYSAEEVLGQRYAIFYPPESVVRNDPEYDLWTAVKEQSLRTEGWRQRKDSSRLWADVVVNALRDARGRLEGFASIMRDRTEKKMAEEEIRQLNATLEQRVQQRTAELNVANRELEAFTYSVAHDLRAPLRIISGFLSVLRTQCESLPSSAQDCITRSQEGTTRMGQLIDDLLDLSRVGKTELHREPTDLGPLVLQIRTELEPETRHRHIEWQIGPLPSIQCDPVLVKQVFFNLLSNSVKYTRSREQTVIQVGQTQADNHPCFFVRDNGIGFDMRWADQLFTPFTRLHRESEYEGTGVGLAIVDRIVRKHNGRIWVQAALGQGATFFFTLPEPVEASPKAATPDTVRAATTNSF